MYFAQPSFCIFEWYGVFVHSRMRLCCVLLWQNCSNHSPALRQFFMQLLEAKIDPNQDPDRDPTNFFKFSGAKHFFFFENIVVSNLKSCIISLLKNVFFCIFLKKIFGSKYSQSIVFCSTLDTFLRDFYKMTLHATHIIFRHFDGTTYKA